MGLVNHTKLLLIQYWFVLWCKESLFSFYSQNANWTKSFLNIVKTSWTQHSSSTLATVLLVANVLPTLAFG